jgi:hypothetical protein
MVPFLWGYGEANFEGTNFPTSAKLPKTLPIWNALISQFRVPREQDDVNFKLQAHVSTGLWL